MYLYLRKYIPTMLQAVPNNTTSPCLQTGGPCVLLTRTDLTMMSHENVLKNVKF